jgi:hypothetical protein
MLGRAARSQAAIDFLTSYGFAILIISVAIYSVMALGVFNYQATPQYCYSVSPFTCIAYSINTTGVLSMVLSQSSGGTLTINGIACSTAKNTTRVGPQYGDLYVNSNSIYYPAGTKIKSGVVVYPGAQTVLFANCYSAASHPATAAIGATFTGYVWINYTFSGLPSSYHNIAQAASFSVKYT